MTNWELGKVRKNKPRKIKRGTGGGPAAKKKKKRPQTA